MPEDDDPIYDPEDDHDYEEPTDFLHLFDDPLDYEERDYDL